MHVLGWLLALAYPVGNLLLWHRVERERLLTDDDRFGDPEPLTIRRPAPDALTPLGWRRWHTARRFTVLGALAWLVGIAGWLAW